MAVTSIKADSRQWQYYIARESGESASDIAKRFGTSPGAVSNAHKRVRELLASGVPAPDGSRGPWAMSDTATTKPAPTMAGIAAESHPLGAVLYADYERHVREVERVREQLDALTDRLHDAQAAADAWATTARESAGFDLESVRAAYQDALATWTSDHGDGDESDADA